MCVCMLVLLPPYRLCVYMHTRVCMCEFVCVRVCVYVVILLLPTGCCRTFWLCTHDCLK